MIIINCWFYLMGGSFIDMRRHIIYWDLHPIGTSGSLGLECCTLDGSGACVPERVFYIRGVGYIRSVGYITSVTRCDPEDSAWGTLSERRETVIPERSCQRESSFYQKCFLYKKRRLYNKRYNEGREGVGLALPRTFCFSGEAKKGPEPSRAKNGSKTQFLNTKLKQFRPH